MNEAFTPDEPRESPRVLRVAAMVIAVAMMLAGPLASQMFGLRSPWLRGWRMFAGQGLGIVQLDGEVQLRDGTRRPLTITDLKDVKPRAPKSRLVEPGRERAALRDVCTRAPDVAKVTARRRIAKRNGWTAWEPLKAVSCPRKGARRDSKRVTKPDHDHVPSGGEAK